MNRSDAEVNEAIARAAAEGQHACNHSVTFDEAKYEAFCSQHRRGDEQVAFIRKNWPRLDSQCPKGCGYVGIYYASFLHYVAGDW